MKINTPFLAVLITLAGLAGAYADSFGSGANAFDIDFKNIGNSENLADTTGYGDVGYDYRIGTYEVTIDQYTKARASSPTFAGTGTGDAWSGVGTDAPASEVRLAEAAMFCNWLTTGNAYNGAYSVSFSGGNFVLDSAFARNSSEMNALVAANGGVAYLIPTEDEWYKAAYFDAEGSGGYSQYTYESGSPVAGATAMFSSNTVWTAGSGAVEQNGTYDMIGNVREWSLQGTDVGGFQYARGGTYDSELNNLGSTGTNERWAIGQSSDNDKLGFRVVAIPEPGTMSLMGLSTFGIFLTRRMRRRKQFGISVMPVRRTDLCDTFCSREELEALKAAHADEELRFDVIDTMVYHLKENGRVMGGYIAYWYQNGHKAFWNHMVKVHEKRVAKRAAFKANAKKKALARFDAFLALIMK